MRDLFMFAVVFGLLPFVFKRPYIGLLLFFWLSLMNPHRLTYGAAYSFPFAAVVASVTLMALLLNFRNRKFPVTPLTVALLLFIFWATLTSFTALNTSLAWPEWTRVMKTLFMAAVAMFVLQEEREIKSMVWVLGLSVGFYGFKGGVFTILSGGHSRVLGPEASYIEDNNSLALALVMVLPILYYLQMHAQRRWLRYAMIAVALLTVVAAAGSYSRGALLAGSCMLFFLWLKSRQKVSVGFGLVFAAVLVYLLMPEAWMQRMESIDDYKEDSSAMGRINAWQFATNVAVSNFMGGGFNTFTRDLFQVYAPDPLDYHVAHSIYFQVLGEHGFVGLALFLVVLFCAWRSASRIIKACRGREELKWASDLATMIQVSFVGYMVGGAFLSLAYYDLVYNLIAVLVVLEKWLKSGAQEMAPAAALAPGPLPRPAS